MIAIAISIAPIFLLVGFGYLLRRRNTFTRHFWEELERLVFYFLFPALLISSIGSADLTGLDVAPIAAVLITATLTISLGVLLLQSLVKLKGAIIASAFQGVIRPNTYLGLSTAAALFGSTGIPLTAICIVAVIPLVNFLAVIAHLRWAHSAQTAQTVSWHAALSGSIRNPVIIACIIGALLNISGLGLPMVVGPFLTLIGKAALPLGLIAVGAGLDISALNRHRNILAWTTIGKLIVLPALAWGLCLAFDISDQSAAICLIFAALPVSATSYVMTRQMGGDGPLMAGIVTATTLCAAITLPVIVAFLS